MLLAFLISGLISLISSQSPWPPKVGIVKQYVDHFSFSQVSENKFNQTYLYYDRHFDGQGPILFYCGNEGEIGVFYNNSGIMFEMAATLKALVVFGEHRYYGASMPFGDKSLNQPFIQYLTIEQTLADYVYMIKEIKIRFNAEKSPVIAFGGSYGAILAAQIRMRYPEIVEGAIASSAQIKWVSGIGDVHDYIDDVTKVYGQSNEMCPGVIRKSFEKILNSANFKEISDKMELCDELHSDEDKEWMLKWARNAFFTIAMSNYPYETGLIGLLPANPVNVSCYAALSKSDPIESLKEAISIFYQKDEKKNCYDFKSQFVECSDIIGCDTGRDAIAWDFQSCTEVHLYDSGKSKSGMFPNFSPTVEQLNEYCMKKWGVVRRDDQLRTLFPLDKWSKFSNIFFSNGDIDPWVKGCVKDIQSDTIKVRTIKKGAHHLDLRSSNPKDPESVIKVRLEEVEEIRAWIKNYIRLQNIN